MASTMIVRHAADPIEIGVLARESGVQPDLVRRFVGLGMFEPPPMPRDAAARIARAARLQHDLGLNSAGAVLACELIARIDELERRLSRYEPRLRRYEQR